MEDVMYKEEEDLVKIEIEQMLTLYTFEDILEQNDMSDAEAIFQLVINGAIILPEVTPL